MNARYALLLTSHVLFHFLTFSDSQRDIAIIIPFYCSPN
uniref:Uncharacterized protein n=1 Tax=Phakopsora pachyrhizi TaxID=170000 RepID=A0A0S1MK03_PHAPC